MKIKNKLIALLLIGIMLLTTLATMVDAADLDLSTTSGSLKLTKYEIGNNAEGTEYKKVLAGVKFEIYKVEDTYDDPTIIPTHDYGTTVVDEYFKLEATTGDDGQVLFEDLPLGRYLVREAEAPANVVDKIANFLVDIPMTNETGDGLVYDVELEPKNSTVYGGFVLTKENEEGTPLEGITFLLQKQDASNWVAYPDDEKSILSTDESGTITLENLPAGDYRFIEQDIGDNTGYILDNKTTYNFKVELDTDTAEAKITPEAITVTNEKPKLTKVVTGVKNAVTNAITETNTANFGDSISFKLVSTIPTVIGDMTTYTIEDEMSEGLEFTSDTFKVVGIKRLDSSREDLDKDTDYSLTTSLNGWGLTFIDNAILADYSEIEITYDAVLSTSAPIVTTGYNNTADLSYSNVVKTDYEGNTNPEEPQTTNSETEIHTGGLKIEKRANNISGKLLQNAEFKLALSIADAEAGNFVKKADGEEIKLTTNESGEASYFGLAYGEYYLIETKAPIDEETGIYYNSLREPQQITINGDTYSNATVIVNKSGTLLPITGGIGAIIFIVIGLASITIGIVLRRKNKKAIRE